MSKLEAALEYARNGWHVLPVVANDKLPASHHGVNDATTDEDQIRRWWNANPNFNIGVAAGAKSGIIVFDIDPRNGGEYSWDDWIAENGKPPAEALVQMTAGGGLHYIAKYAPDVKSCKLDAGIDLLSDGRYFLAAPSTIGDKEYCFDGDESEPFQIPEKWIEAYRAKLGDRREKLTGEIIRGNRNDGLASIAGSMRSLGMDESEILVALLKINENRCEIPLGESEVRQIARSVARYSPESDVAANGALGGAASEALLASEPTSDFYFTRATSFLSQPAPMQWIVKGWVPDGGLTMIYGASGAGKTFISLDMAASVATGQPWCGCRVKQGLVVYLCGEGNYGFRKRVAAWAYHRSWARLDDLIVSNRAVDLNYMTAEKIIEAVKEVSENQVSMVVVDTLNNHMAGDENSAKDTRELVNACKTVIGELRCGVMLNHHVGHGAETQSRARGSSAWKASLDSSLLVSSEGETVRISATKMKDARPLDDLYGRLDQVTLPWLDDDGEPDSSAVFVATEPPAEPMRQAKRTKLDDHIDLLKRAWYATGAEVESGKPYITRAALLNYLVEQQGLSPSTAGQYVKPVLTNRLIGALTQAGIVEKHDHGWAFVDGPLVSQLLLSVGRQARG